MRRLHGWWCSGDSPKIIILICFAIFSSLGNITNRSSSSRASKPNRRNWNWWFLDFWAFLGIILYICNLQEYSQSIYLVESFKTQSEKLKLVFFLSLMIFEVFGHPWWSRKRPWCSLMLPKSIPGRSKIDPGSMLDRSMIDPGSMQDRSWMRQD